MATTESRVWEARLSEDGSKYFYFNATTGETRWDLPSGATVRSADAGTENLQSGEPPSWARSALCAVPQPDLRVEANAVSHSSPPSEELALPGEWFKHASAELAEKLPQSLPLPFPETEDPSKLRASLPEPSNDELDAWTVDDWVDCLDRGSNGGLTSGYVDIDLRHSGQCAAHRRQHIFISFPLSEVPSEILEQCALLTFTLFSASPTTKQPISQPYVHIADPQKTSGYISTVFADAVTLSMFTSTNEATSPTSEDEAEWRRRMAKEAVVLEVLGIGSDGLVRYSGEALLQCSEHRFASSIVRECKLVMMRGAAHTHSLLDKSMVRLDAVMRQVQVDENGDVAWHWSCKWCCQRQLPRSSTNMYTVTHLLTPPAIPMGIDLLHAGNEVNLYVDTNALCHCVYNLSVGDRSAGFPAMLDGGFHCAVASVTSVPSLESDKRRAYVDLTPIFSSGTDWVDSLGRGRKWAPSAVSIPLAHLPAHPFTTEQAPDTRLVLLLFAYVTEPLNDPNAAGASSPSAAGNAAGTGSSGVSSDGETSKDPLSSRAGSYNSLQRKVRSDSASKLRELRQVVSSSQLLLASASKGASSSSLSPLAYKATLCAMSSMTVFQDGVNSSSLRRFPSLVPAAKLLYGPLQAKVQSYVDDLNARSPVVKESSQLWMFGCGTETPMEGVLRQHYSRALKRIDLANPFERLPIEFSARISDDSLSPTRLTALDDALQNISAEARDAIKESGIPFVGMCHLSCAYYISSPTVRSWIQPVMTIDDRLSRLARDHGLTLHQSPAQDIYRALFPIVRSIREVFVALQSRRRSAEERADELGYLLQMLLSVCKAALQSEESLPNALHGFSRALLRYIPEELLGHVTKYLMQRMYQPGNGWTLRSALYVATYIIVSRVNSLVQARKRTAPPVLDEAGQKMSDSERSRRLNRVGRDLQSMFKVLDYVVESLPTASSTADADLYALVRCFHTLYPTCLMAVSADELVQLCVKLVNRTFFPQSATAATPVWIRQALLHVLASLYKVESVNPLSLHVIEVRTQLLCKMVELALNVCRVEKAVKAERRSSTGASAATPTAATATAAGKSAWDGDALLTSDGFGDFLTLVTVGALHTVFSRTAATVFFGDNARGTGGGDGGDHGQKSGLLSRLVALAKRLNLPGAATMETRLTRAQKVSLLRALQTHVLETLFPLLPVQFYIMQVHREPSVNLVMGCGSAMLMLLDVITEHDMSVRGSVLLGTLQSRTECSRFFVELFMACRSVWSSKAFAAPLPDCAHRHADDLCLVPKMLASFVAISRALVSRFAAVVAPAPGTAAPRDLLAPSAVLSLLAAAYRCAVSRWTHPSHASHLLDDVMAWVLLLTPSCMSVLDSAAATGGGGTTASSAAGSGGSGDKRHSDAHRASTSASKMLQSLYGSAMDLLSAPLVPAIQLAAAPLLHGCVARLVSPSAAPITGIADPSLHAVQAGMLAHAWKLLLDSSVVHRLDDAEAVGHAHGHGMISGRDVLHRYGDAFVSHFMPEPTGAACASATAVERRLHTWLHNVGVILLQMPPAVVRQRLADGVAASTHLPHSMFTPSTLAGVFGAEGGASGDGGVSSRRVAIVRSLATLAQYLATLYRFDDGGETVAMEDVVFHCLRRVIEFCFRIGDRHCLHYCDRLMEVAGTLGRDEEWAYAALWRIALDVSLRRGGDYGSASGSVGGSAHRLLELMHRDPRQAYEWFERSVELLGDAVEYLDVARSWTNALRIGRALGDYYLHHRQDYARAAEWMRRMAVIYKYVEYMYWPSAFYVARFEVHSSRWREAFVYRCSHEENGVALMHALRTAYPDTAVSAVTTGRCASPAPPMGREIRVALAIPAAAIDLSNDDLFERPEESGAQRLFYQYECHATAAAGDVWSRAEWIIDGPLPGVARRESARVVDVVEVSVLEAVTATVSYYLCRLRWIDSMLNHWDIGTELKRLQGLLPVSPMEDGEASVLELVAWLTRVLGLLLQDMLDPATSLLPHSLAILNEHQELADRLVKERRQLVKQAWVKQCKECRQQGLPNPPAPDLNAVDFPENPETKVLADRVAFATELIARAIDLFRDLAAAMVQRNVHMPVSFPQVQALYAQSKLDDWKRVS